MLRLAIAPIGLLLMLSACAAPAPPSWQKPGAGEAVVAKDTAECRETAEQEAELRYPHGFSTPTLSAAGMAMAQQRDNTDRANAATAAFNACMRDRGYVREPK